MSAFLNFDVYRKATGGAPYINQCVMVEEADLELTMSAFIRNRINQIKGEGRFVYLDSEIVHLKTGSGRTVGSELLHKTVSEFQQMLLDRSRNAWSIEVRIDAQNTLGRGSGESNAGISLLFSKSNAKSFLESKHSINQVERFLNGYDGCTSKKAKLRYCKELGDECISLDEQANTIICSQLRRNKLGYYTADPTDKEQCIEAMGRLRRELIMIRPHITCLSVNNNVVINGCHVLSHIKNLRPTGINAISGKNTSSSSAMLRKILLQITNQGKNGKDQWPKSYYAVRKGINPQNERVGESIVSVEEKIVKIVRKTIHRLDEQSNRTANRIHSVIAHTKPDLVNTNYTIKTKPNKQLSHYRESKCNVMTERLATLKGLLIEAAAYTPFQVTDQKMGIERDSSASRTMQYGATWNVIKWRQDFLSVLAFEEFPILVYTYKAGGNIPAVVFVYRVNKGDTEETPAVKSALDKVMKISPIRASPQIIRDITLAMDYTSCRSVMFRNAVVQTVVEHFCGTSMSSTVQARSPERKKTRDDLALLISAGERTDDFVEDLREINGGDGTRFRQFFDIVEEILTENGNLEAHSRRHVSTSGDEEAGGTAYIPPAVSIRDLHEKAKQRCIEKGGTDVDIPCLTTLMLHFVPCNETHETASRYFGTINVKRGMTKSSGRSHNRDSHYNAKLWQIYKFRLCKVRAIIERIADEEDSAEKYSNSVLNCDYRNAISLVGKDDKTNINTSRWGAPAGAVVRQSNRALMPAGVALKRADHDHTTIDKITPSVHLFPNIPRKLGDSLYVGNEGNAELRVALHTATLDPSDVFKHNLRVLEDIVDRANRALVAAGHPVIKMNDLDMEGFRGMEAMPLLQCYQADGGPDENICYLRSQTSAFANFLLSGADRTIHFRGCSGESWRLIAERPMSLINLPLSNCAFLLDKDCLGDNNRWFIDHVLKRSGTMAETRKCITEFNHQLEVVKRMKRRIATADKQEVPVAVVCAKDDLAEAGSSDSTNSKDSKEAGDCNTGVDAADKSNSLDLTPVKTGLASARRDVTASSLQFDMSPVNSVLSDVVEEREEGGVNVEYDKGYKFERFFRYGGWFEGQVIHVIDDDLRRVRFDEGKKREAIVTTVELARLENEPAVGNVGFQFVKIFRGGGVFNGKVERKMRSGKLFCRFDDNDTHSFTKKALMDLKSINYHKLRKIEELDHCDPSKNNFHGHIEGQGDDSRQRSSESSDEDKPIAEKSVSSQDDSEHGSCESTNEDVPIGRLRAKKSVPSEDAEDSDNNHDMSDDDSKSYKPNAKESEEEDETAGEEDWGSDELVESVVKTRKKSAMKKSRGRGSVVRKSTAKRGNKKVGSEMPAPATNWTYGKWLMTKSLEELENMEGADVLYRKTMQKNMDIISERMSSMKLGEKHVIMTEYPTDEKVHILHDVLRKYEPAYDESIRSKAGQTKMGKIDRFFRCSKHSKITSWGLEFKLCGEDGCELCPRKPRVLDMDDDELTKAVLGFCPLPRVDGDANEFLPIDECERLLENGDDLAKELDDLRRIRKEAENIDKKSEENRAKKDRDDVLKTEFNWTKVRHIVNCSNCSAPRCVFSKHAIGNAKGPTKKHMAILEKYVEEHEYVCGDAIRVYSNGGMEAPETDEDEVEELPMLFCKEERACWDTVESQYYATESDPTKGGRIQTKTVCCHCYSDGKLANNEYVDERRDDRGGKKYLPICEACVDDGANLQTRKGAKKNKHEEAKGKRKKKSAKRMAVRSTKRAKSS